MSLGNAKKTTARQLATRYGSDNLNGQPLEYDLVQLVEVTLWMMREIEKAAE